VEEWNKKMNSDEAVEIARKFLKAERQPVKECVGAFRPSEAEVKHFPAEAKDSWVVQFLIGRPENFDGLCPGHVIVLVNDKTGEARFDDVL
jgi:hypothetical protein